MTRALLRRYWSVGDLASSKIVQSKTKPSFIFVIGERRRIQVDTITNTWSDYGTNNTNDVVDDGSTVTHSFKRKNTYIDFSKPTSASWL